MKEKNNNLTIVLVLIIVILAVFIGLLVSGTITLNNTSKDTNVKNDNTLQTSDTNSTTTTTQNENDTTTTTKSNTLGEINYNYQSFNDIVSTDTPYAQVDIDNDGIDDLLIETTPSDKNDMSRPVYVYRGTSKGYYCLGSVDYSANGHYVLYKPKDKNYLIEQNAHMGYEQVKYITIGENTFNTEIVLEREITSEENYMIFTDEITFKNESQ